MRYNRYNRRVRDSIGSVVSFAYTVVARMRPWVAEAVSRNHVTGVVILRQTRPRVANVVSRVRHYAAEAPPRATTLVVDAVSRVRAKVAVVVPRARLYAYARVSHWRMMMDDGTLAQPFVRNAETHQGAENAQSNVSISASGSVPSVTLESPFTTWIRLIRPSALLLVLVPALTALALLWLRGAKIMALPALAGVISLLLVQAGASLLDVYLEYARRTHLPESERSDHLTARALLAHAVVRPLSVLRLSILLIALGAIAGIPLIATGGWKVVLLGISGLVIAFLFSATSFALKRFSLADIIIGLALGPGIVTGMMLAQRQTPTGRDMLFAFALGLLAMLPAEGAHLRDAHQDVLLGRKTLVTELGDGIGRAVYVLFLLAGMTLLALAALPRGAPHGALLAFFALPSFSIPISGALLARQGYAREQVVAQELRAYAIFAFWLLLGLVINAILVRGLGPIPAIV